MMPLVKEKVEYGRVKGSALTSKISLKTIPFLLLLTGRFIFSIKTSITAARIHMPAAARKVVDISKASAISMPTAGAQAEPMS